LMHGLEVMGLHPLRRGRLSIVALTPIQNPYRGTEARGPDTTVP